MTKVTKELFITKKFGVLKPKQTKLFFHEIYRWEINLNLGDYFKFGRRKVVPLRFLWYSVCGNIYQSPINNIVLVISDDMAMLNCLKFYMYTCL